MKALKSMEKLNNLYQCIRFYAKPIRKQFLGRTEGSNQFLLSEKANFLSQITGCSNGEAEKMCRKLKTLKEMPEEEFKKSITLLEENGINKSDIAKNLKILSFTSTILQNHLMIFEEAGFIKNRLDASTVLRFYELMNVGTSSLYSNGYIDSAHIGIRCAKYLPSHLEGTILDGNSPIETHTSALQSLLEWKLETNKINIPQKLAYKSLRLVSEALDLYVNEIKLPKERISKSLMLLSVSPQKIRDTLDQVPTLAETDVRNIIIAWPKVIFNKIEYLLKIDEYLKGSGISLTAINKLAMVYTLNPSSVYKRLSVIKQNPELSKWLYHPYSIRLITNHDRLLKRLSALKKIDMKCDSISMLYTPEVIFQKHVENETRTQGNDIITFLSQKLAINAKTVRQKLKRHPYWLYIPLVTCKQSFDFIHKKGFTNEEIYKSIFIVLYERDILEEEFKKLKDRKNLECCKCKDTGEILREFQLPLLLYFIELPFNFTKEAVWVSNKKETNIQESS